MQPKQIAGMSPRVMTLVSLGCHPISGRGRLAEQDGRAVELGMKLAGEDLALLHAESTSDSAFPPLSDIDKEAQLRRFLGMGLPDIAVVKPDVKQDVVASLMSAIIDRQPQILLTGVRAESGEGSGMVPYLLAEMLAWPMVSNITDIIEVTGNEAQVLQALPRGQRRLINVKLPFIASVNMAANKPRQSAFGPAKRGRVSFSNEAEADALITSELFTIPDNGELDWQVTPAKPRSKRMKVIKAKTAADRLKAATVKTSSAGGKVMVDETLTEKAQAIIDLLQSEGVLKR